MSTPEEEIKVTIGIQARLGSTRFPRKIMCNVEGKRVIDHVLDNCRNVIRYQNKFIGDHKKINLDLALLVPEGDSIIDEVDLKNITLIFGPEHDVLARYQLLAEKMNPHYIVRITSDCPMIPPFVVNKHINMAVANKYDYFTNADERCRTTPDGWDCEVISKRFLKYAFEYASDPYDREHVTPFMKKTEAPWIRKGALVSFLDLSGIKISVDTEDDLNRVREEYKKVNDAFDRAEKIYGRKHVYRF